MKFLKLRSIRFLFGMILYALAMFGLSSFNDYRWSLGGFMILTSITFAMALWALIKSTKAMTVILIGALALIPVRASEEEKPEAIVGIVVGCGCLIVGAGVCYAIWRICKKLPPPPKKGAKPPATNEVDEVSSPIISRAPALAMPDMDLSNSASEYEVIPITFQSSTNGTDWRDEYTATNWLGPDRVFSVLYSNSVPLMTNQCRAYWTNETFVMNFSEAMAQRVAEPVKFWRAVQQ